MGRDDIFAPNHAPDPQAAHQPLHRAAVARQANAHIRREGGDILALAPQDMQIFRAP